MKSLLKNNNLILTEAAIVEQLRRTESVELHPLLVHAPLVYNETGRAALRRLFQSYISVALTAGLPILICAPTWRANQQRVNRSQANSSINSDAVRFMMELREVVWSAKGKIKIGGLIGCKNDCYKPEQGLSATEAVRFHSWQIEQLAGAGVDFLIAETLPNVEEAAGIVQAMGRTETPHIISFVINRHGFVLDGTALCEAIERIDEAAYVPPLCYMVNCSYPSFLCAEKQPAVLFSRLLGYQANASSLDQYELEESAHLEMESVAEWGREMLLLNREYGMKILGGCCGTGVAHLRYLVENRHN